MDYYCLMVKTDGEERFQKDAENAFKECDSSPDFYFFKKKLRTNAGKVYEENLFKGYIFMGLKQLSVSHIEKLKGCKNFYHFLNSNTDIQKITGKDLVYLQQLIQFGQVQGFSKVEYDVNGRIVVREGPLKGFAGNIIRVNKKRQRVTVALEMFNDTVKFDLAYDLIEPESTSTQKNSN